MAGSGFHAGETMADLKKAYLQGQQELADQKRRAEEEAQRKKELERLAHVRDIEAGYRLIFHFNENADVFEQNGIGYCLDEKRPGIVPTLYLFRKDGDSKSPKITRVMIDCGSSFKTYSLSPIVKKSTDTAYTYDDARVMLSDDAEEAAAEILRLLGRRELMFDTLWHYDKGFGDCTKMYFEKRTTRAVLVTCGLLIAAGVSWWLFR